MRVHAHTHTHTHGLSLALLSSNPAQMITSAQGSFYTLCKWCRIQGELHYNLRGILDCRNHYLFSFLCNSMNFTFYFFHSLGLCFLCAHQVTNSQGMGSRSSGSFPLVLRKCASLGGPAGASTEPKSLSLWLPSSDHFPSGILGSYLGSQCV